MLKDNQNGEVKVTYGETLISEALDKIFANLPEGMSVDRAAEIIGEKTIIKSTVRKMCCDHQASKVIIHIGENGEIIPEIHLKGRPAINYIKDKNQ